jgi:Uri superfamily endonuclease
MPDRLPEYGTYVLILHLRRRRRIRVGALGTFDFPPGYYGYVGSAFGSGGVAARLKHHLISGAKPFWHIDYLRAAARPTGLWVSGEWARREHLWARLLEQTPGVEVPAPKFGSSDCNCPSHLFRFFESPSLESFAGLVRKCVPSSGRIRYFRLGDRVRRPII